MSQRTSVLPPSHPVRGLVGLARQIALPHEYAPERFPSFPALERTAVMAFNTPSSVVLPASSTTKLMLARQAGWPCWMDQTFTGMAYSTTYVTQSNASIAASVNSLYSIDGAIWDWTTTNQTATSSLLGLTVVNATSFAYSPMAIDAGTGSLPFTWVPPNADVYIIVAGSTAVSTGVTLIVNLDVWNSPGEVISSPTAGFTISTGVTGGMSGSFKSSPAISGQWIRPVSVSIVNTAAAQPALFYVNIVVSGGVGTYASSASTLGTFTVSSSPPSTTCFLPLNVPSEFSNSALPWYSTRTTAAAVLATNVTQVLNKGGTVLAGRVSPNVINPFQVSSAYVNNLHPAEKAFLPLEMGFYSYCPPSSDLTAFWDYTLPTRGSSFLGATNKSSPVYRLDNDSLVNIAFFTATAVGENLAMNIDWHIEFRTSSALFPIGLSAMTLESLHTAQIALASVGFFFENIHHKPILEKVTSAVKRYAPTAIGLVNPTAGRLVKQGMQLLVSSKNRTTVPSTSASASGMTKPKASGKKKNKPSKAGKAKTNAHR